MRANIYIRKYNEEAWEKIKDKSDWVNDCLEAKSKGHEKQNFPSNETIEQVVKEKTFSCEHGAGLRLCIIKKCRNYQFRGR